MAKQPIRKKIIEQGIAKPEEKPILTLVIDGNSILKQSLVDETVGTNGKEYGAIKQCFILMKRIMQWRDWNFCYIVFDGDNSGQLRYDIYPEYKANRDKTFKNKNQTAYDKAIDDYCKKVLAYSRKKKQLTEAQLKRKETDDERFQHQRDLLIEMCECLSIRTLMYDEVEGDDLIAYLVKNKQPNEKICIVSGDRDLTQLINDDVCVYVTQKKEVVTHLNSIDKLGYNHENVVLFKMLCGDTSDNIKGVTGMGKDTFFKHFPEAVKKKIDLAFIFDRCRTINDERIKNKQKPLKVLENVLKSVTTGSQGDKLYEINEKLIDLKKHILLTKEAEKDLKEIVGAPLDPEGREYKDLYEIVRDNGMSDILKEDSFGRFFSDFAKLIDNEKKYYKENTTNS